MLGQKNFGLKELLVKIILVQEHFLSLVKNVICKKKIWVVKNLGQKMLVQKHLNWPVPIWLDLSYIDLTCDPDSTYLDWKINKNNNKIKKQAVAELGQAQLKLGLSFTLGNLHEIKEQGILFTRSDFHQPLPNTEHK